MPRLHKRALRLGAALLLLAGGVNAGGDNALPQPLAAFEAEYRVTNGSMQLGTTRISLQPHAGGWRYRSVTEASGLASLFFSGKAIESSTLERHGDWLRPTAYRHIEPEPEDNVEVDFDWAKETASIRDNDGTRELDLEPGTFDGFSVTLELIRALAAGEDGLEAPVIDDSGEQEVMAFERVTTERIEVPAGTFTAVRVDRIRRNSDRETISWLAPKHHWIAVRIDQRDDGELEGRLELTALAGAAAASEQSRSDAE